MTRTSNTNSPSKRVNSLPSSGEQIGKSVVLDSGGIDNNGLAVVWNGDAWVGFDKNAITQTYGVATPWIPMVYQSRPDGLHPGYEASNYNTAAESERWFCFKYLTGEEYEAVLTPTESITADAYIWPEDASINSVDLAADHISFESSSGGQSLHITPPDTDRMVCWIKVVNPSDRDGIDYNLYVFKQEGGRP